MLSTEEKIRNTSGFAESPSALNTALNALYMKRKAKPRKYILRYLSASSYTSDGVCIHLRILPESMNPIVLSIRLNANMAMSAVEIELLTSFIRPAPNNCDMITEHPIPVPIATITKRVVIELEAPTAASASGPKNLPTITESAIL